MKKEERNLTPTNLSITLIAVSSLTWIAIVFMPNYEPDNVDMIGRLAKLILLDLPIVWLIIRKQVL